MVLSVVAGGGLEVVPPYEVLSFQGRWADSRIRANGPWERLGIRNRVA